MKSFYAAATMIALSIAALIYVAVDSERIDNEKQFSAWVKLTGNPKNLTLDEFKTLKDQNLIP